MIQNICIIMKMLYLKNANIIYIYLLNNSSPYKYENKIEFFKTDKRYIFILSYFTSFPNLSLIKILTLSRGFNLHPLYNFTPETILKMYVMYVT